VEIGLNQAYSIVGSRESEGGRFQYLENLVDSAGVGTHPTADSLKWHLVPFEEDKTRNMNTDTTMCKRGEYSSEL
jgi:hypothetical protein